MTRKKSDEKPAATSQAEKDNRPPWQKTAKENGVKLNDYMWRILRSQSVTNDDGMIKTNVQEGLLKQGYAEGDVLAARQVLKEAIPKWRDEYYANEQKRRQGSRR